MTHSTSPRRTAVIWDFDGTLVDSHPRNLSVNRTIIEVLTGQEPDAFPALESIDAYEQAVARAGNWRDFYASEFRLEAEQVERAGSLWPELQLADSTPQQPFSGIPEALESLSDLPHAILSQNDSIVIRSALERTGLLARFREILGHGELDRRDQKPAGGGLVRCIESLELDSDARVFFVGDHVTDAMCARDAARQLGAKNGGPDIVSIGACFGRSGPEDWQVEPDLVARSPADVVTLVRNGADPMGVR